MSREAWSKGWTDAVYHGIMKSSCPHYQAGYKHGVWQKNCLDEENKKIDAENEKIKDKKKHRRHYAFDPY